MWRKFKKQNVNKFGVEEKDEKGKCEERLNINYDCKICHGPYRRDLTFNRIFVGTDWRDINHG